MNTAGNLASGNVFARDFRIIRPLAEGGMGAVYVVEQLSTGKLRALKVLRSQLLSDERMRARFVREATVAATIESDHVIEVVSAGVDQISQMPWIAMELLSGLNLGAVVARRRNLTADELLEVFLPLCHALAAAHRQGIVHRDLKPENVFLARTRRSDSQFTVKLLDFGIATVVQEATRPGSGGSKDDVPTARSQTTGAIGSPLWMSPEQITLRPVSPATDVWALGLLAFWALIGKPYWKAAHASSVLLEAIIAKLFSNLDPASERAAALDRDRVLPPGFDAWFARCVSRDTSARFADASLAIHALETLLADRADAGSAPEGLGALLEESAQASNTDEASVAHSIALPLVSTRPHRRAARRIIGAAALVAGAAAGSAAVWALRGAHSSLAQPGIAHAMARSGPAALHRDDPPRLQTTQMRVRSDAPDASASPFEAHAHTGSSHARLHATTPNDAVSADLRRDVTAAMHQSLGHLEDQADALKQQLASIRNTDDAGRIQRALASAESRADSAVAAYDRQADESADPAYAAMFRDLARQARAYLAQRRHTPHSY